MKLYRNTSDKESGRVLVLLGLMAALTSGSLSAQPQVIYWPMPGLQLGHERAKTIGCFENLKAIGNAAETWAMDNRDQLPPSFAEFTNEITFPAFLFCPADGARLAPTNWADVALRNPSYEWIAPPTNWWDDLTTVSCRCRVHEYVLYVDGSVHTVGRYHTGWPEVIAHPLDQTAEPGANVRLQVSIAPDAFSPLSYQWRRETPYYVTNAVLNPNHNDPQHPYWVTNIDLKFTVLPLAGQTNAACVLRQVSTSDSDFYSVAVSNEVGIALSARARVRVEAGVAQQATNAQCWEAVCLNNLKQIALCGRLWAQDHFDQLPPDLAAMTDAYGLPMFGWPNVLFCPADNTRPLPADWSGVDINNTSYEVVWMDPENPYDVFCRCKVHGFYAQVDGTGMMQPIVTGIQMTTNHTTEIKFRVFAGRANTLEASPDLVNWSPLATYPDSSIGEFTFSEGTQGARRFYRLRLQ